MREKIRLLKELKEAVKENKPDWFLTRQGKARIDDTYDYEYRFVICYALRNWLLTHKGNAPIPMLKLMIHAIEQSTVFEEDGFLKIYPLPDDKGLVVIDDSNGCFPLVLWKPSRKNAFEQSVKDILNASEKTNLLAVLSRTKSEIQWSDSLQRDIEKFFNYDISYPKAA